MKILSLNLHCFKEDNYQEKFKIIADFIKEKAIDVCLFQEVSQRQDSKLIDNVLRCDNSGYAIALMTGYYYYFHPIKLGFGIYEEGLAILSRAMLCDLDFLTLSKTQDFHNWLKRDLIWATTLGYRFYNVHLGWSIGDEITKNQIIKLLDKVTNDQGDFFLAGDFNYPDNTEEIAMLKEKLYSVHDLLKLDAKLYPTFHAELDSGLKFDNRMIDYIFVNKPIKIKKYELVFNDKNTFVSDHSGILIEL